MSKTFGSKTKNYIQNFRKPISTTICSRCGKSVSKENVFKTSRENICPNCFSRCELITCTECGKAITKNRTQIWGGVPFCTQCLKKQKVKKITIPCKTISRGQCL